eukprot:TRINITY_DN1836_c0_g1_i1.p2 TRINITY_DN1836_c0_g1~~TRINITY_DN1836_c0_g1_i1.p2  ORF type:complete len:291 (-),score=37.21 TRINITY_DN1836_c0_g1_i1:1012-1884(-)
MWKDEFGVATFVIPLHHLLAAIVKRLNSNLSEEEGKVLGYVLDTADTGFVTQYKFAEFLKSFGPFTNCVVNTRAIFQEKWFVGFLARDECDALLESKAAGTFLLRFSGGIGSFALAFQGNEKVYHVKIRTLPQGFAMLDQKSKEEKVYQSLHELVQSHYYVLTQPCMDKIYLQPYFQGELSREESCDVLFGEPAGTFLVRFAQSTPLAVSYVAQDRSTKHAGLTFESGRWHVSLQPDSGCRTLDEILLNHDKEFKYPLHNRVSSIAQIIVQWTDQTAQISDVINDIWRPS